MVSPSILGRGTVGTIYALPSNTNTLLGLKTGHDPAILLFEFNVAREVYTLYAKLENSPEFLAECGQDKRLPQVPRHHHFHPPEETKFWEKSGLEYSNGLAGIEMDRIPPMPSAVGTMLIRKFFDLDKIEEAVHRGEQDEFLVQLLFGRSTPNFEIPEPRINIKTISTQPTTFTNSASITVTHTRFTTLASREYSHSSNTDSCNLPYLTTLANLPAPMPVLKEHMQSRAHRIVASIAAGYALMHWGCHIDGSGTEFVLGGGSMIAPWMLDFDKCRHMDLPLGKNNKVCLKLAVDRFIVPAMVESGYVPRPGEEDDLVGDDEMGFSPKLRKQQCRTRPLPLNRHTIEEKSLWETWTDAYITVGKYCCEAVHQRPELAAGPEMACEAFATAVKLERMGFEDEDMVIFENSDAGGDESGWCSEDDTLDEWDDDDSDDDDDDDSDDENCQEEEDKMEGHNDGEDDEETPTSSEIHVGGTVDLDITPDTSFHGSDKEDRNCRDLGRPKIIQQNLASVEAASPPNRPSHGRTCILDSEYEKFVETHVKTLELEDPHDGEELIIPERGT